MDEERPHRSRWINLLLCDECWSILRGDRIPTRVIDADRRPCGWCDEDTTSGIFVRAQVKVLVT